MNFYSDIPIEPKEKRRLLLAFLLATFLLISIGIVLYGKYLVTQEKRESVRNTHLTLLNMKDVFSSLQDMETGQRGYLLTGEKRFLEPYEQARHKLDQQMKELRQRLLNNPGQLRQLEELQQVSAQQRELLERQIKQRNRLIRNSIITERDAETGKAVMDHLRSLINRMVEDEEALLAKRNEAEQGERQSYIRVLLLCVLLALIGLIITNGLMIRASIRRRNVELALQRTQEFSSTIIDHSPDCIKVLSAEGRILSMNNGGLQVLGIDDVAQIMGKPWVEFWKDEHRKKARKALEEAQQGNTSRFEAQCATMKGELRWWEVIVTPIRDGAAIETILVISRDITERYEIEREMRASEKRFRQMADTMPQMVWTARPDGVREYFNKRWYEYTGMEEGDINWQQLVHPEDHTELIRRWNNSVATGEPYEIEYRLRRAGGVFCWTLGRALPTRDTQGKIVKWVGTSTVIEEQKRVEAELREARDLAQAANNAKSEFLANMSHEIRTPMNAVVGLSNLLGNSNLTEKKRGEFVRTIQLSALQLMELINDLLDIAKIETANVELEKVPFNLAELLEEIISVMGVRAKEKNIELMVKYTPEMNTTFLGDPLRLRQILMNLVSNAVKFTEKGMVTLQADHCENEENGAWDICFDVVDTGIGIPPAKLETIFSKFSQADTSITRKYGGTGLGLSICKSLVELMGGHIKVVSTEGLGSRFTVGLPLMPTTGEPVRLKNRRPHAGISKKYPTQKLEDQPMVLLVEDYKANILVATQTIEDCGCRWELAENGKEALAKVKAGHYDVILMDVQMPTMDGITATQKIREWENKTDVPRTPIIGVTAYSMEGDRDKCLEAGMDDYLSKPFNPEELKEKIRRLVKGKGK